MDISSTMQVAFMLIVLSYLFKPNNKLYLIVLEIYAGRAIAYLTISGLFNIWFNNVVPLGSGNLIQIIPIVLGIMLWFGFYKPLGFLSRYPSVLLVAGNMGSTAAGAVIAQMYKQVTVPVTNVNVAISLLIAVLIIIYFIATFKVMEKGILKYVVQVGRWLMMFTFGFSYGATLVSGFSGLVERMEFVFWTWLPSLRV